MIKLWRTLFKRASVFMNLGHLYRSTNTSSPARAKLKPKTIKSLIPFSPVFVLSVLPFSLSVRLNLVRLTLLDVSGVKPLLKVKIWFAKRSLGHLLINICSVSGWGWWQTRPHLEIGWSGNIGWGRGGVTNGFLLSSKRREKEEAPKITSGKSAARHASIGEEE